MTLTLMVWHSRHILDAILQNALLNEAFPIDSGAWGFVSSVRRYTQQW